MAMFHGVDAVKMFNLIKISYFLFLAQFCYGLEDILFRSDVFVIIVSDV